MASEVKELSERFDVIVAGGGAAGAVAALAAARTGAKTLVIERLNCLGGNLTAGIMGTTWTFNDQEKVIVKGIPLEIIERLKKAGAVVSNDVATDEFTIYDTELTKFLLFEMAEECGLHILLHTFVSDALLEDDAVQGVIIQNKSGRQAVRGTVVVDASGDADVAALAGAPFDLPAKDKLHPISLLCKIGNVDIEELAGYYKQHPKFKGNFTHGRPHPGFHAFRLAGPLQEPYKKGLIPKAYEYLKDWFLLFYSTPRPREIILNMTGGTHIDGTDAWQLTRGEVESRKLLLQAVDCFKRFVPGFKDAYIMSTALTAGVRETRRIRGEYMLTKEDVLSMRRFPDAVMSYNAPVVKHTADGKDAIFVFMPPGGAYDFPYRVMVPQRIENLLVAGRCISVAADTIGSTRNMTACMALGQAAGTAAALSVRMKVRPRALDVTVLQRELIRQGAHIVGVACATPLPIPVPQAQRE
jgi:hypothetical protein